MQNRKFKKKKKDLKFQTVLQSQVKQSYHQSQKCHSLVNTPKELTAGTVIFVYPCSQQTLPEIQRQFKCPSGNKMDKCTVALPHERMWFSCSVSSFVTPWTVARQAPLSTGFSRQEDWSGLPWPPPGDLPRGLLHCRQIP